MWERDFFPNFFFFRKQPIENKYYFYRSFSLTKDSFPLTKFFLYYQILENMENYFYRRFSSEINKALSVLIWFDWYYDLFFIICINLSMT